jgi:hypothetical protein
MLRTRLQSALLPSCQYHHSFAEIGEFLFSLLLLAKRKAVRVMYHSSTLGGLLVTPVVKRAETYCRPISMSLSLRSLDLGGHIHTVFVLVVMDYGH